MASDASNNTGANNNTSANNNSFCSGLAEQLETAQDPDNLWGHLEYLEVFVWLIFAFIDAVEGEASSLQVDRSRRELGSV